MPRICSPERAPRYRFHEPSGQAIVTIDGRDYYLGTYKTAASREAYRRKIGEWAQHGGMLPAPKQTSTVAELVVAYIEYADGYYRKDGEPTNEVRMIKAAIKIVRELYGRTPAADFGPLALQAVREGMIGKDWCRNQINKQIDRVKRMFKWATRQQIIPGGVYEAELFQLGSKIAQVYVGRILAAQTSFISSVQSVTKSLSAPQEVRVPNAWQAWANYVTDWVQRSVPFADTLRQRGRRVRAQTTTACGMTCKSQLTRYSSTTKSWHIAC
jgi:hypothetical protein